MELDFHFLFDKNVDSYEVGFELKICLMYEDQRTMVSKVKNFILLSVS